MSGGGVREIERRAARIELSTSAFPLLLIIRRPLISPFLLTLNSTFAERSEFCAVTGIAQFDSALRLISPMYAASIFFIAALVPALPEMLAPTFAMLSMLPVFALIFPTFTGACVRGVCALLRVFFGFFFAKS